MKNKWLSRPLVSVLVVAAGFVALNGCARKNTNIQRMERPWEVNMGPVTPYAIIHGRKFMQLINVERNRRGYQPLKWSEELYEIASLHSRNMDAQEQLTIDGLEDLTRTVNFEANYFSANVTSGHSVFEAYNDAISDDQQYRNLIDPNITHVGIGIHDSGEKQYWLFGETNRWYTAVYAQNPAEWQDIRDRRAFEAFIAEQIRSDKEFDEADLNLSLFKQRLRKDGEKVGGFTFSTPALEAADEQEDIPTWSVIDEVMQENPEYQPTDEVPVDIVIEPDEEDGEAYSTEDEAEAPNQQGEPAPDPDAEEAFPADSIIEEDEPLDDDEEEPTDDDLEPTEDE